MEFIVDKNIKLKEFLENAGYRFPCGGKGLCGKCQIIAKDLEPTSKDRLFFSKVDIEKGYRIACDKITKTKVTVKPLFDKKVKVSKPSDPGIFIIIDKDIYQIFLVGNGEILDSHIAKTPSLNKLEIQGALGAKTIELYEEYGLSVVDSIMLLGEYQYIKALENTQTDMKGTMPANLFSMPSLDVYIPPFIDNKFNHLLLYAMDLEDREAIILEDYVMVKNDTVDIYEVKDGYIKNNIQVSDIKSIFNLENVYTKELLNIDLSKNAFKIYSIFRQRNKYEYQLEQAKYHKVD